MVNHLRGLRSWCEKRAHHVSTLRDNNLSLTEAHHFANTPIEEDGSLHWNIPQLYQETIDGLRVIGGYEETIDSIVATRGVRTNLLFGSDGSLITPTFHHGDRRSADGMKKVYSKVPLETVYEETGVQQMPTNTLFQLGAEKWLRLRKASHLLPVADAFNPCLADRAEMSRTMRCPRHGTSEMPGLVETPDCFLVRTMRYRQLAVLGPKRSRRKRNRRYECVCTGNK